MNIYTIFHFFVKISNLRRAVFREPMLVYSSRLGLVEIFNDLTLHKHICTSWVDYKNGCYLSISWHAYLHECSLQFLMVWVRQDNWRADPKILRRYHLTVHKMQHDVLVLLFKETIIIIYTDDIHCYTFVLFVANVNCGFHSYAYTVQTYRLYIIQTPVLVARLVDRSYC